MSQIDRSACTARLHGHVSAYRQGCRCEDAKKDKHRYDKHRRLGIAKPRLIDPTGTRRRLQALAAIGWRKADICARLGFHPRALDFTVPVKTMPARKAARIAQLYDELSMIPGPSEETRRRAAAKGWSPPLAWDDIDDPASRPAGAVLKRAVDEVAVERAVQGHLDGQRLRRAEAHEAIRRLRAMQVPAVEIARRVGVSERTVQRLGGAVEPLPHSEVA